MAAQSITTILWRSMKRNRVVSAAVMVTLVAAHLVLVAAALAAAPVAFGVALMAAYVAEYFAVRRAETILLHAGSVGAGQSQRFIVRDLLAVVLLLRLDVPTATVVTVSLGLFATHFLRLLITAEQTYVRKCRRLQVLTRNVDLSALRIPNAPNPLLFRGGQRRLLHLTVPIALGAVGAALTHDALVAIAGVAVSGAVALFMAGGLLWHAVRSRHLSDKDFANSVVFGELREYRPEVVLYYSLDPKLGNNAYQVDMWVPALERMGRRFMILVRERAHIERIGRTTAPVVCLTGGSEVMNLDVPSLKVALYVGNTGKNIHLLRHTEMSHVFIGHGDSDKAASANPFCKAYDRVFVAGRAARDRFHAANSGVADENMIEVGRPQLDKVRTRRPRPSRLFTVLYAPTWEGWTDDTDVTSVTEMGPAIVEHLLSLPFDLRVVYKPHPLTGVRSPATREAHAEIMRLLKEDNDSKPATARELSDCEELKRRRDALPAEYAELTAKPPRTDSTHRARDNRLTDQAQIDRLDAMETEIARMFWGIHPRVNHRTVLGATPHLYDCFNESDMMISDVSSVVSDFIISQKPYVICNPSDLPADEFTGQVTAAAGAYLLGSSTQGLEEIVKQVHDNDADAMSEKRLKNMRYLLGDEPRGSQELFTGAIARLATKDDRR